MNVYRAILGALRKKASKAERKGCITSESNVLLYELTTTSNAVTKASAEAVTIAVLDEWQVNFLSRRIMAVTQEQALRLRSLPWVIMPRQRGAMVRNGDQFEFRDSESGDVWSVSIEALQ